jgi:hypothetical protein
MGNRELNRGARGSLGIVALLVVPAFLRFAGATAQIQPPDANEALDIGGRLELFVDRFLIDSLEGVVLRMHEPVRVPSPMPPSNGHYATVIKDGDTYRLYNRAGISEYDGSPGERTEYFESTNGVNWRRPVLGLFEVVGSRDNNVVLADAAPFSHNFSPFLDRRPGVPPTSRYKALAGTNESGLVPFVSADGIRWSRMQDAPVITEGMFDSQNVSFWSESEQRYVCYFRSWTGEGYTGLRAISRTTSSDFVHWTNPVQLDLNAEGEHLYTSAVHPYFRAPHIYVALPTRFQPDRGNATDILFMTSRGGDSFDRTFMEAFIRPGRDAIEWANRANYAAVGVVPTTDDEMSIYVRGRRYVLRTDGFVSLHAGYIGGTMTTRSLRFDGSRLELNVATSASGQVRVELLNADGSVVDGFGMDDSDPIVGNSIAHVATWRGSADVGRLAGQRIRIRFQLQDADLYALQFIRKL